MSGSEVTTADAAEPPSLGREADLVLARLLRLDPAAVTRIRDRTPPRVRPRPQTGPTASYD